VYTVLVPVVRFVHVRVRLDPTTRSAYVPTVTGRQRSNFDFAFGTTGTLIDQTPIPHTVVYRYRYGNAGGSERIDIFQDRLLIESARLLKGGKHADRSFSVCL
jgi:hypothetical protein